MSFAFRIEAKDDVAFAWRAKVHNIMIVWILAAIFCGLGTIMVAVISIAYWVKKVANYQKRVTMLLLLGTIPFGGLINSCTHILQLLRHP